MTRIIEFVHGAQKEGGIMKILDGYKTIIGGVIAFGLGAYLIVKGDTTNGIGLISAGFAVWGIGNKLENLKGDK